MPTLAERSRALKSAFRPLRLDAYHLRDAAALDTARERHEFTVMAQGRQPDGSPRKPKLKTRFDTADSAGGTRVVSRSLTT